MADTDPRLRDLCDLYGVAMAYHDAFGVHREATPEVLLSVLSALGAEVSSQADVPDALRSRRLQDIRRVVDEVTVASDGRGMLALRVMDTGHTPYRLEVGGQVVEGDLTSLPVGGDAHVEGEHRVDRTLTLPELPAGLHPFSIEIAGVAHAGTIVAAPTRCTPFGEGRGFGLFAPLYALWSERRPAVGDFSTLRTLMGFAREEGASLVGTLPLLAQFLDEPFEPSPYGPASRLFLNELYIDLERVPELTHAPQARHLLESEEHRGLLRSARERPHVDYRPIADLRLRVLRAMAEAFFQGSGDRREALSALLRARPRLSDYARFRGATARLGPWSGWSAAARAGDLADPDVDETSERYHLYVQLLAHEQLAELAGEGRESGCPLYLDLPVGVHPDGYDVWREREAFAHGVSAGAPPDAFFRAGQDWGFRPMHPEGMRNGGYRYLRECLAHHMTYAGLLRIDHVLGLHRMFMIPDGAEAVQGVYVRSRPDELYAVVSLLSEQHGCAVVGEDLGTVPPEVRPRLSRHGMLGMHVLQFATHPWGLDDPRAEVVASLGTHDTPTFAAFLAGDDVEDRVALGQLDEEGAVGEREQRRSSCAALAERLRVEGLLGDEATPYDLMRGAQELLARSPAKLQLIGLEDLWLEERPQNTPGTHHERANWCRRLARPLQEVLGDEAVRTVLRRIDGWRRA